MNRRLITFAAVLATLAAITAWWIRSQQSSAVADEPPTSEPQAEARIARANYDRLCLPCHGSLGDGNGPAAPWLWPRPRNFASGEYKWRSTPIGTPPTDDDLERAIRHGVPGTSMRDFGDVLSGSEIRGLIVILKQFSPQKFSQQPLASPAPEPPEINAALLDEGKTAYTRLGCDKCHGQTGMGDGPSAKGLVKDDGTPETTYDLTTHTFRRPRSEDEHTQAARIQLIYRSLTTGLAGTPMPSFKDAGSTREIWAVAAFVESFTAPISDSANRDTHVATEAAGLDTVRTAYWHGSATSPDAVVWGKSLQLQGSPPSSLTPAQASLSANQCARCHSSQFRDWRQTLHGGASSPGLLAQLIEREHRTDPSDAFFVESCLRCHAPLAEQAATLRPGRYGGDDNDTSNYKSNPEFSHELQSQGINCASCHLRKWTRNGPPRVSDKLISLPAYPRRETDFYERSDFCLGCHQLTPSNLVNGRPLLNTYREWLEGPYFKRGIQCQHCHMPNREHTWKGIHDPETFRQGVEVSAVTRRDSSGTVSVRVKLKNIGAGHYLPTTPTPAAWIIAELLDDKGRPIPGAISRKRIGRHIEPGIKWIEHEDTRIRPGESGELAAAWSGGNAAKAATLMVTIRVEPDEFYERFYRTELGGELTARQREMYTDALARTIASQYIAIENRYPIAHPSK